MSHRALIERIAARNDVGVDDVRYHVATGEYEVYKVADSDHAPDWHLAVFPYRHYSEDVAIDAMNEAWESEGINS